jgi:hypothetical protein
MTALPSCSEASSFSTGAIILHGPHHSAQKSTRTGDALPVMVAAKFSWFKVSIFMFFFPDAGGFGERPNDWMRRE